MSSKILYSRFNFLSAFVCAICLSATSRAQVHYVPATMNPPAVQREFRGAWIATVGNVDWPSKPGLPTQQQKQEMIDLLDRAVKLNLNAIVLQVRPACDAIYASKIEPWSYYLTGKMGQAPQPYYDPLEFAITEAHKRGLELHAWFNPYRAELLAHKYAVSKNHISRTHPEMVVRYGSYLWLDPGEKAVQDYSLRVVMDVVNRYDIDGVHFDDYFYPYKEQDGQKIDMDFPDYGSWKIYHATGNMTRDDWRRENVNEFVQRVYSSIKAAKPWVKFGISPFGIWQPGNPPQIKGFNAYNVLYCDSRKWLANGWLDYCAPQLYWAVNPPEQSYPVLLKWWLENNPKHRNIWPGLDADRVGGKWKPEEILNQVKLTRELSNAGGGEIYWSIKALLTQRGRLGDALATDYYAQPALIPASPWLETNSPAAPKLEMKSSGKLKWKPERADKISVWVLQTEDGGNWRTQILPEGTREAKLGSLPQAVALTAIDRCGVASPSMVLQKEVAEKK
jgi:uncharacterized lipoprotein YddW (UPF0748 family)